MCGITGVVRLGRDSGASLTNKVVLASRLLRHRGPDDSGYLFAYLRGARKHVYLEAFDEETPSEATKGRALVGNVPEDWSVALHGRRLSILDPTVAGHQPFSNEDKTIWLVFNGEVYNFHELRSELTKSGHDFTCDCDTEVIIHGYEEWGLQEFLKRARGMWAFALLDLNKLKLYLVRDYFGIKPLYYLKVDKVFVFTSEIKVLKIFRGLEPDWDAVLRYLLYLPIGSEQTFYSEVRRLTPASYLELDLRDYDHRVLSYWHPPIKTLNNLEYNEAVTRWREAFLESVKMHLRSDFPIAFLLSGGVDSSSITMAWRHLRDKGELERWASKHTPIAVTFSHGGSRDETSYAVRLARELGVDVKIVFIKDIEELWRELPRILYHHDEPPYGPSVIAEWFVMREASKYVRVVVSGQGGDELLMGYQRYVYRYLSYLLKKGLVFKFLQELWRFRDLLLEKREYYLFLRRVKRLRRRVGYSLDNNRLAKEIYHNDFLNGILMRDVMGEGLQRLLHHMDRDSMAFSLEARVPFLDPCLAELTLSLPGEYKLSSGWTKRVHRDALKGILPDYIRLRRSKIGFEVPEGHWLKELTTKRLVDWDEVVLTLSSVSIPKDIIAVVRKLTNKLLKGKSLNQAEANYLWRALFLYMWLRTNMGAHA